MFLARHFSDLSLLQSANGGSFITLNESCIIEQMLLAVSISICTLYLDRICIKLGLQHPERDCEIYHNTMRKKMNDLNSSVKPNYNDRKTIE